MVRNEPISVTALVTLAATQRRIVLGASQEWLSGRVILVTTLGES